MEQKYSKGDKVKVKIGHWIICNSENEVAASWKFLGKDENGWLWYDMRPSLTEEDATVEYSYDEMYGSRCGDTSSHSYSLNFEKSGRMSWFEESNLMPI